jgi:DUF4097 and DUF4098 domain-containing protein YvlB
LWSFFSGKPSIQFNATIETPEEIDLELHTSGGPIEVATLNGHVQANTSGGRMKFRDIKDSIKWHTRLGPIEAWNINGDVNLSTSGGLISVSSITGQTKLSTSGGGIYAHHMQCPVNGEGPILKLKTSGGGFAIKYL